MLDSDNKDFVMRFKEIVDKRIEEVANKAIYYCTNQSHFAGLRDLYACNVDFLLALSGKKETERNRLIRQALREFDKQIDFNREKLNVNN